MQRMNKHLISRAYLFGFAFVLLGLLFDSSLFMLVGIGALVYAWWSDDDENNHIDPPGTVYMDRDGRPVGGAEKEAV